MSDPSPMNDADGPQGPDAEVERALGSLRPVTDRGSVARDALLYRAGYEAAAREQRMRAARWRGASLAGWAAAAGLAVAMLVGTGGPAATGIPPSGDRPTIVRDAEVAPPTTNTDRPAPVALAAVPFREGPASLLSAGLFVDARAAATAPAAASRADPPLVAQLRLERALGVPAEQWGAGARMIAPRY